MHAVLALLVALEHRRRTGEGQLVESTMVEAALNVAAEQVLEHQAYGRLLGRDGNRGRAGAPQNVYACRGTERWLALAVTSDAEWTGLLDLLGRPAWATAPALATRAGRHAAADAIDAGLARWCGDAERDVLVARLLAAGIPAAPVLHPADLAANPQVRARGFLEPVTHPVAGTHDVPGLPLRVSGIARWYRRPAPTLGEHTAAVLRERLGLGDDELAALARDGIVGERPQGL
jgi:crotonobetainyl-CoA:carnitine CoA-transferase CaiB-like acyl-CoA transferase